MSFFTSPLSSWESYSHWERIDLVGVLMVAVGVLGEALLVIRSIWFPYNPTNFPPLESVLGFKKKHLEIFFGILVAFGVALELRALPMSLNESHVQIAKLENKTEELRKANEQARSDNNTLADRLDKSIKARIELEMAYFPRIFEPDEQLGKYAGIKFGIAAIPNDSEAASFSWQLTTNLNNSQWEKIGSAGLVAGDALNNGVTITMWGNFSGSPLEPKSLLRLNAARELVAELKNSQIMVKLIIVRLVDNSKEAPDFIDIFIGKKPSLQEIKERGFDFNDLVR